MTSNLGKRCVAEFVGTFTLIFIGVGAIHNASDPTSGVGLRGVALAHGLAIAVMASATGGISGGHLNPAVTFGLFTGGTYLWAWKGGQATGTSTASFRDLYPLPQNELSANPNLKQNPGY